MGLRLAVDGREWAAGTRTGIGRYLETSLRGLLEAGPGWEYTVFLGSSGEERLQAPPISYARLSPGPAPWVDQVVLPRRILREGADVFFSPYVKMPWRVPCPSAVTIHDLFPLTLPPEEGGLSRPGRLRLRLYAGLSISRADAIITVSEASARDIRKLFDPDPARLHVIPEGVDPRFFDDAPRGDIRPLERAGIETPYLAALTNFQPHKNIEVLLDAWSRVEEKTGEALLVLAGEGPRREELMRESEGRAGAARIRWPGRMGDEELAVLYRHAAALLQPSFAEGFGLPVAEAMACGTAVVVSDRGSLPEVVGGAGIVLDPGDVEGWADTMVRLVRDVPARKELGREARERAEVFRLDRAAAALHRILEGLPQRDR
ncbi:MAG: glycosyltransferase family 1 protein [bacterium]